MKTCLKAVAVGILMTLLVACQAQRPVLYPNDHLTAVGSARAQADIDDCIALAEQSGAGAGRGAESAKNVATAGAVGAAAGAVFGAIMGKNNVGKYALASGGAAAAGSGVNEAFKSGEPDKLHKQFVNKCLKKKGYEITGWK